MLNSSFSKICLIFLLPICLVSAQEMTINKRAESVKNYLTSKHNISTSRIMTTGKGESDPVSPNNTEDGKKQNRRVEFKKL